MGGCNYSFYNRKTIIHRMDGCNSTCELTLYTYKKGISASACLKETPLNKDHFKWPPEIIMVQLKCMAASAPLK